MTDNTTDGETRGGYLHLVNVETRWADNDLYGHVNNATYYTYFDTVVNDYLIEHGGLDIVAGPVIGVAVETMCRFRQSVAYPETLEIGMAVSKLGNSSVRYDLAVFKKSASGGDAQAVAVGYFVHVFIDRTSAKPVPIPAPIRAALERLVKTTKRSS
jgi:acyl-CoA thioester hydrolase